MARFARLLVAAVLILAVTAPASTAHAQATLAPLFTVAGLMNTGGLGSFFACTNTDTVPVAIGIDVFGQAGNQLATAVSNAVSVGSHASILFGTQTAAALTVTATLGPIGIVNTGSAVVESASKKIVCSSFLADPNANAPTSMTTLTMAYKGKQKGD